MFFVRLRYVKDDLLTQAQVLVIKQVVDGGKGDTARLVQVHIAA